MFCAEDKLEGGTVEIKKNDCEHNSGSYYSGLWFHFHDLTWMDVTA